MKNNKKAFTIVELVIVIAVIAILAAVLIPTFSSLIEKANINSDTAAVKQMNTYLSADEQINGKASKWQDAVKVLSKSNLDAQNYKALSADHYLVYDSSLNRVLYVRAEDKAVIYPEEYSNVKDGNDFVANYGNWTTLEGKMVADDSWRNKTQDLSSSITQADGTYKFTFGDVVVSGNDSQLSDALTNETKDQIGYVPYFGENNVAANLSAVAFKNDSSIKSGQATFGDYTIAKLDSADKLTDFASYIEKNNNGENHTLIITDDLDLRSTEWKPLNNYHGSLDGKITTEEGEKSAVISNLKMTDATAEVTLFIGGEPDGGNTYYGFISVFSGSYFGNVKFENVEISKPGINTQDEMYKNTGIVPDGHMTAAVIGNVSNYFNQDMLIENVVLESGSVKGLSRVGGLFGNVGLTKYAGKDNMTEGEIKFVNCINKANVSSEASVKTGYGEAGGIIGRIHRITGGSVVLENCENYGNVTSVYAGGLIGINSCKIPLTLDNCKNYGNVKAEFLPVITTAAQHSALYAGGLIGKQEPAVSFLTIYNNCVSEANLVSVDTRGATVTVKSGQYVGTAEDYVLVEKAA